MPKLVVKVMEMIKYVGECERGVEGVQSSEIIAMEGARFRKRTKLCQVT